MVSQIFEKYVELCLKDDAAGCGDLVQELDDETCDELYKMLVNDERTKNKLVRPLWYNYNTQKMRVFSQR